MMEFLFAALVMALALWHMSGYAVSKGGSF